MTAPMTPARLAMLPSRKPIKRFDWCPDAADACERAASILKAHGFQFAFTSGRSEACYYEVPGFDGLIRVAAHRFGRGEQIGLTRTVYGAATFGSNQGPFSDASVMHNVQVAVGRFALQMFKERAQ